MYKTHTWGPDVQVKEAFKWGEEHDSHHDDLSLCHVDGAEGESPRDVGLPVGAVEQGGGTQTLDRDTWSQRQWYRVLLGLTMINEAAQSWAVVCLCFETVQYFLLWYHDPCNLYMCFILFWGELYVIIRSGRVTDDVRITPVIETPCI